MLAPCSELFDQGMMMKIFALVFIFVASACVGSEKKVSQEAKPAPKTEVKKVAEDVFRFPPLTNELRRFVLGAWGGTHGWERNLYRVVPWMLPDEPGREDDFYRIKVFDNPKLAGKPVFELAQGGGWVFKDNEWVCTWSNPLKKIMTKHWISDDGKSAQEKTSEKPTEILVRLHFKAGWYQKYSESNWQVTRLEENMKPCQYQGGFYLSVINPLGVDEQIFQGDPSRYVAFEAEDVIPNKSLKFKVNGKDMWVDLSICVENAKCGWSEDIAADHDYIKKYEEIYYPKKVKRRMPDISSVLALIEKRDIQGLKKVLGINTVEGDGERREWTNFGDKHLEELKACLQAENANILYARGNKMKCHMFNGYLGGIYYPEEGGGEYPLDVKWYDL